MIRGTYYRIPALAAKAGLMIWALALCLLLSSEADAQTARHKMLFVVTSNDTLKYGAPAGYYFPEAVEFYTILKRNGYDLNDIDVVSPKGGMAPMYERTMYLRYPPFLALPDYDEFLEKFDNSLSPSQIDPSKYKVIYYIGGFASLFDYPNNQDLALIARSIYERGGIIAAICHGTCALMPITLSDGTSLLRGKTVATRPFEEDSNFGELTREQVLYFFPFILEEILAEHGAIVDAGPGGVPNVAVSERVVTGQNPASAQGTARSVLDLLASVASVGNGMPEGFSLEPNLPNPFSSRSTIRYSVPARSEVRLGIFNLAGEQVLPLVDGMVEAGRHEVVLDGADLQPGIYFYRLEAGGKSSSRTMIVSK